MRSVMTTSIAVNLNTTDDQSYTASGTSNLATSGGPVSLTLNSDRKDDNLYHAWYNRNLTGSPATAPGTVTGNITWGYDSRAHFESGSNANLTVYSAYSSHNEYFNGNRSETLTANSAWAQVNGGVPFGSSYGNLAAVRNYSGGSSDVWNGYGGFASTYCGTESQTWNDPSIASYDARNLTGTRFTPHDPPGVPAPQPFNTPSMKFVMPPALVEDTEAVAVEEGEESSIGDFLWGLVPGHSLLDAYRDYQKGDYVSAGLNGVSGLSDLLTLGTFNKAESSLKFFVGVMKVRIKDSVVDAVAKEAGNAVAERYGPEAGFVTRMIVSAKLSKDVSQQNKTQLGFAADGVNNYQGRITHTKWGALINYKTGKERAIDHIKKGHFYNSRLTLQSSRFSESNSSTARVKSLVQEAVAKGTHSTKNNVYAVMYRFNKIIGTDISGRKTSTILIYIDNSGNALNAFPVKDLIS